MYAFGRALNIFSRKSMSSCRKGSLSTACHTYRDTTVTDTVTRLSLMQCMTQTLKHRQAKGTKKVPHKPFTRKSH